MPVRAVARLSLSRPEGFVVFDLLVNFSAEDWKSRRLQCRELRSFPLVALVCWLASFQVTSVEEGYPCGGSSHSKNMLVTLVTHAKDRLHVLYTTPTWAHAMKYSYPFGYRPKDMTSESWYEIQRKS